MVAKIRTILAMREIQSSKGQRLTWWGVYSCNPWDLTNLRWDELGINQLHSIPVPSGYQISLYIWILGYSANIYINFKLL